MRSGHVDVSAWRLANLPGTRPALVAHGDRRCGVALGGTVVEAESLDEALARALRALDPARARVGAGRLG